MEIALQNMSDPAALLAFFASLYTTHKYLIDNPVVSGILGGRSDKLLDVGLNRIKGIWNRNRLPQNADLLRAIREAHFGASIFLCRATMEHLQLLSTPLSDLQVEEEKLLKKKVIPYLKRAQDKLSEPLEPLHDDPAFMQIELILSSSQNATLPQQRADLKNLCKRRLVTEIETELNLQLPATFVKLLNEGWEKDGISLDWFDIFCLKFADILKDEKRPRVSEAFQDRMLSDIRVDTIEIKSNVQKLIAQLETGQEDLTGIIFSHWEDTERWFGNISNALSDLKTEVRRKDEVQQLRFDTIERKLDALPANIIRMNKDYNLEDLQHIVERILALQNRITELKADREMFLTIEGSNPNQLLVQKSLSLIERQILEVTEQLEKQNAELKDASGNTYKYIILERNVTLHLKDRFGELAVCEDKMLLYPIVAIDYYDDVFTQDGNTGMITTSGEIISREKDAGLLKVRTKFDRIYQPGETLTYHASAEYINSHTDTEEYFIVWCGFPVQKLHISVQFPEDRKPVSYSGLKKVVKFDRTLDTIQLTPLLNEQDGLVSLSLQVDRPGIFDRYRIDWSW